MEKIIFDKNKIKKIINILIISLPIFLISGPFFSDLTLVIIILFFLYKINQKKNYFKNIYFVLFGIFLIYIILNSLILSETPQLSIKPAITYFRFGLFSAALLFFFDQEKFEQIYKILLSIFIVLFIDSIFQKTFNFNIVGIKMIHPTRVSSFFGDELIMGSYVIRLFPILVGLYFLNYKQSNYFFIFFLYFISLIIVLLSAEKTALFLYILFFLISIFFFQIKFIKKLLAVLLIFLTCLSVLSLSNNIKERVVIEMINNSGKGKYIFSKMHDSHYRTSFKIIEDKIIFGTGVKSFRVMCKKPEYYHDQFSCSTHPHNLYLQLFLETGIIGFLFLLILFLQVSFRILYFVKAKFKNDTINYAHLFFTIAVFINIFPIAPSGNFFNNWNSILFYYIFSFYLFYELKIFRIKNYDYSHTN